MIPPFNHSHVLPPYLGLGHSSATASPYESTASEVVSRFAITPERIVLLRGFLAYRASLRALGFNQGFQWIDGSFVENVEKHRSMPPKDIDVITFTQPPANMQSPAINAMMLAHPELFDRVQCKARFGCDTFMVRLNVPAQRLVRETTFWHGVFSHRREDQVWKGLLQIPLESDDGQALQMLENANLGENNVASA